MNFNGVEKFLGLNRNVNVLYVIYLFPWEKISILEIKILEKEKTLSYSFYVTEFFIFIYLS